MWCGICSPQSYPNLLQRWRIAEMHLGMLHAPVAARISPELHNRLGVQREGAFLREMVYRRVSAGALAKNTKAAQPRSSEKNAASRAGQTPCARWAVEIYYTRALMYETAEKARLDVSEPIEGFQVSGEHDAAVGVYYIRGSIRVARGIYINKAKTKLKYTKLRHVEESGASGCQ